jgi:phospholipid/cholesterol/gamma-HCH transport system substrate-binding protein
MSPSDAARRWGHKLRHSGLFTPTALKVLAFAAACLVVLGFLAAKIGNMSLFTHRVSYSAALSDATGLQPGDNVKIAGVTVGQVTDVVVVRDHAVVRFSLNDNVHMRSSTQIGTQWHNVLGQQFLYLYPGSQGPVLAPGSTIPMSHQVSSADVGALLNSLGPLLGALHPQQANAVVESLAQALQGNESQVNALIANAATVSQSVGNVDTQVGQVIDDMNQVLGALSSRSGDLGTVVANLQTVSSSLAGRNDLLDQTVANLGQVAGEVATLEANTHGSLSSAISNLAAVSSLIQAHEADLNQGLTTLGSGLAPYTLDTTYGQWFEIQTVYTCLADETGCTYYQASNPPSGAGPLGMPAASGLPGPANGSGLAIPGLTGTAAVPGIGGAGGASAQGASVGNVLQMVAGQGTFRGSGS